MADNFCTCRGNPDCVTMIDNTITNLNTISNVVTIMGNWYQTLKSARNAKGLTQIELATLLQLGQSYLSQVERGKHDVKTSTLVDWARVLGLEVMLVPKQHVPAVSYLIRSGTASVAEELPPAYGPLPDEV